MGVGFVMPGFWSECQEEQRGQLLNGKTEVSGVDGGLCFGRDT